MHLKKNYYKDRRYATKPNNIYKFRKTKEENLFKNVVCVWLCVEQEDIDEYVKEAAGRVDVMNKNFYNEGHILVMPFAHLSNNLAKPSLATSVIKDFAEKLRKKNYKVSVGSFGTNKDFLFEIYGHPASVSFFEFPYEK